MPSKKGSSKKKKGSSKKSGATNTAKKVPAVAPSPKAAPPAPKSRKAPATQEPAYSSKVIIGRGVVRVQVTLHRTPPQTINFEPTSDHFYLDTLKDTRKYLLKFAYPHGIKVSVDPEPEATFEYGILKVDLPIADFGELKKKRSAYEQKTGNTVRTTTKKSQAPKVEAPPAPAPAPVPTTTTVAATQKSKKKKKFVNKDEAVGLLSEIATQQEAKINAFIQKEAAIEKKQQVLNKKAEARKRKREAVKEDSRQAIKKKIKLDKEAKKQQAKPKAKKKAGQVRFADEE